MGVFSPTLTREKFSIWLPKVIYSEGFPSFLYLRYTSYIAAWFFDVPRKNSKNSSRGCRKLHSFCFAWNSLKLNCWSMCTLLPPMAFSTVGHRQGLHEFYWSSMAVVGNLSFFFQKSNLPINSLICWSPHALLLYTDVMCMMHKPLTFSDWSE